MIPHDRRGFTLTELLVVSVLGALVVLSALQLLTMNRRTYTAQAATISGQQTTRMAVDVLFSELREVSPGDGDILSMSPDSITVRLMRKFSMVCETDWSGTHPVIKVIEDFVLDSGDTLYIMGGANRFMAGDSVFVFADNNEERLDDDVWIPAWVSAADTSGMVCPQPDSLDAVQLTFQGQTTLFATDSVGIGAPVRSYREYTFGTTTMNGDVFLARRDTGDYVPIAGPLAATDGLEFVYRDRFGNTTSDPSLVSQIQVTIRTGSEVLNSLGGLESDSVLVSIHTRN